MTQLLPGFARFLLGSALLGACAGAPARTASRPARPGTNGSPDPFLEGPARRVRSRALDIPVEFSLPSKDSWQLSDGPNWFVARHAPTASELAIRTWREGRLVRRADCVTDAWLSRPALPVIHEEDLVERRPFAVPAGFDTELMVGVEPIALGISGYAIAIGASVGRCYAAVFTTSVTGPTADREMAARLASAVERILSGVRMRSVDERAVRRRLVSTPSATPE